MLDFVKAATAAGFYLWRHIVEHLCGRCAMARTVREHMDAAETCFANDTAGGFEVLLGFARETDDYIRSERRLVQGRANAADAFQKASAGVASPHACKDSVGATLQT